MAGQAVNIDDMLILTSFRDENTRDTAYTQLVRKYQERLYWHIRRMVVEHEDTNDVLQNVFIKVWKYLANFKGDSNLYTWLYRIATNETITWLEQKKKRGSVSLSDEESPVAERLVAQKGFDANKLEWRLQEAIQALPEKQRIVFNLRYYDEMPYDEMAQVLETSAGALKASYHHAVKKVEAYILQTANG
jgi:RNA polymerase sigma-70 factor (ECF subfamily)